MAVTIAEALPLEEVAALLAKLAAAEAAKQQKSAGALSAV